MVFFFAEKQAVSGSNVETGARQESVMRGHPDLGVEPVDTPTSSQMPPSLSAPDRCCVAAASQTETTQSAQSSDLVMEAPSTQ